MAETMRVFDIEGLDKKTYDNTDSYAVGPWRQPCWFVNLPWYSY